MRILHGVTGEGLGHTMRARVLAQALEAAGHQVLLAASGRAAGILRAHGLAVLDIAGLSLVYRRGQLERTRTLLGNLRRAPAALVQNLDAAAHALAFGPQCVITDFDSFSYAIGRRLGLPVVSFDHQHVLSRCEHPEAVLRRVSYDFALVRAVVSRKLPRCDRYLVTSFFAPPVRAEHAGNTCLVGPVVRPELAAYVPSQGEHVVVYQTGSGDPRLMDMLAGLRGHRFKIYGATPRPAPAHVAYCRFSESGFLADLAAARCVITGGGYTTLSEAISLGKPILSIPIRHQGEQELNAAYLEHEGLGLGLRQPSTATLAAALTEVCRLPHRTPRPQAGQAARVLARTVEEVCA